MSDIRWCDAGEHPFSLIGEGHIRMQAAVVRDGKQQIQDLDTCSTCAKNSKIFSTQNNDDELDKRIAELEKLSKIRQLEADNNALRKTQPET